MHMKVQDIRRETVKPFTAEVILSELERTLHELAKSQSPILRRNLVSRAEKIEDELKKLEIESNNSECAESNGTLDQLLKKVIAMRINAYQKRFYHSLWEVCSNIIDNSREIEIIQRIISQLNNEKNGVTAISRILSHIEVGQGKVKISKREGEVLTHLLEGKSNNKISLELGISEKTVKNHLWKIYRKFGVENRTQLFHKLICP